MNFLFALIFQFISNDILEEKKLVILSLKKESLEVWIEPYVINYLFRQIFFKE